MNKEKILKIKALLLKYDYIVVFVMLLLSGIFKNPVGAIIIAYIYTIVFYILKRIINGDYISIKMLFKLFIIGAVVVYGIFKLAILATTGA